MHGDNTFSFSLVGSTHPAKYRPRVYVTITTNTCELILADALDAVQMQIMEMSAIIRRSLRAQSLKFVLPRWGLLSTWHENNIFLVVI